jgi:hypothetical protein
MNCGQFLRFLGIGIFGIVPIFVPTPDLLHRFQDATAFTKNRDTVAATTAESAPADSAADQKAAEKLGLKQVKPEMF